MAVIPPQRNPGDFGHLQDHNAIVLALTEFEAETEQAKTDISALQAAQAQLVSPQIVGTLSSTNEETWPTTGSPGQHYLVGTNGALVAYNPALTPPWEYVGNIAGPEGIPGTPGTIVGILPTSSSVPPNDAAPNSLWWVPDVGQDPPATTYTPSFVGATANYGNFSNLQMSYPESTAAGDVAVLVCSANTSSDNRLDPTDAGWTEVVDQAKQVSTNHQTRMFVKLMSNSGGAIAIAKTGVSTQAVRQSATMMVFRDVQLTNGLPQEVAYAVLGDTSPVAAPTVNPNVDSIVCGVWFNRRSGTGTLDVTPPGQWVETPVSGINNNDITTNTISTQGAYDLTVASGAVRPITSGHLWDYNEPVGTTTYAYTIALAKKTA